LLQDLPLTYRFGYVSNTTGQEQLLASQGQASPFTEGVILPVGTFAVVVYVRDAFLSEFRGSVASDRLSAVLVTCVPFVANATALQGTVNSALDSVLLSGDSAGAVAQVAVFASVREVTLSWSLAFSFSPDLSYFFSVYCCHAARAGFVRSDCCRLQCGLWRVRLLLCWRLCVQCVLWLHWGDVRRGTSACGRPADRLCQHVVLVVVRWWRVHCRPHVHSAAIRWRAV
jgi:hypothetical protein